MLQIPVLQQKYLEPKVFHYEIKKCQHFDEVSDELMDMFHKVVTDLSHTHVCAPTAIINGYRECIKNWKNFNPDLSDNPFVYFSNVAKNGMLKIQSE